MNTSVAICTYNGEKFIAKQILSILQQCQVANEIIICDDCSLDNTILIIEGLMLEYPSRIKLIRNKHNLGAIYSFEKCIQACSGDIIFLSDQDDIWYPNKIQTILNVFASDTKAMAVFSDGNLIDSKGQLLESTLWEKWKFTQELQTKWLDNNFVFSELLFNRNVITGATLAFKKKILPNLLPFELPFGYWHDAWIGLVAAGSNGLRFIKEPTIYYRVHQQQQVGVTTGASDKKYDCVDYPYFFAKLSGIFPDKRKIIYPRKTFTDYIHILRSRLSRLKNKL